MAYGLGVPVSWAGSLADGRRAVEVMAALREMSSAAAGVSRRYLLNVSREMLKWRQMSRMVYWSSSIFNIVWLCLTVGHQDFELCAAAFAPAEDYSVGLPHGESLLGPHRNQVPFDFRNQSECEAKYLAVDAVVEGVSFFCGVEPDFFPEAFGHDLHNVGEGAAEPGNLGDDECVSGLETAQQKSQLPLLFVFFTAYYFCNPAVDGNLSGCRVTEDLLLLVGQMLLASADPEITCYHVSSII